MSDKDTLIDPFFMSTRCYDNEGDEVVIKCRKFIGVFEGTSKGIKLNGNWIMCQDCKNAKATQFHFDRELCLVCLRTVKEKE